MKIYALCGLISSGKDTFAEAIIEKYGEKAYKMSFAGILKDIVSIVFGWDRKLLEGDTLESRYWRNTVDTWWSNRLGIPDLTPRWVLQSWGTDVLRNHFHSDIWLAALERKMLNSNFEYIVITDCRFENEMKFLNTLSSEIIWIRRNIPEWVNEYINNDVIPKNIHYSEYSWIKFNFTNIINNDCSREEFKDKVKKLF